MNEVEIANALDRIPYAKTLGVVPLLIGDDFTLKLPYIETNIGNPMLPALHGGAIGGFMEISAIAQIIIQEPKKKFPKPIGVNINYLQRGKPVDTFARAFITRRGSRITNVRVLAWQASFDDPIATLQGHFLTAATDD